MQLAMLSKREKEAISHTEDTCDSEDKLEKTIDYQHLVAAVSKQQVCRQLSKDISYHVGNSYMEKVYGEAEQKRRVDREMANLHHKEFVIKRKYLEVSPDTGLSFKDKFKAKTYLYNTYQFKEHTGGYVDQETWGFYLG